MARSWAALVVLAAPAAFAACGSNTAVPANADDGGGDAAPADATSTKDGGDASPPTDSAASDAGPDRSSNDGAIGGDVLTGSDGAAGADATQPPEGGVDGGADAPHDAPVSLFSDADVCSWMAHDPAPVVFTTLTDASAPPASTGGTIASGTYYITSVTSYGGQPGCTGMSQAAAIVVAPQGTAGTYQEINSYTEPALIQGFIDVFGRYTTSGTTIAFTNDCGGAGEAGVTQASYTATPTTLTLVGPALVSACGTTAVEFTKQ
jgi:hypothetical protein